MSGVGSGLIHRHRWTASRASIKSRTGLKVQSTVYLSGRTHYGSGFIADRSAQSRFQSGLSPLFARSALSGVTGHGSSSNGRPSQSSGTHFLNPPSLRHGSWSCLSTR